jgi:hypothetical protein
MPVINFKESFGFRIFGAFAVSTVFVIVLFSPFFIYYQEKNIKDHLIMEGKMLTELLSYNSRTGVFAENESMLMEAAEGIMIQKNVIAVSISRADNSTLVMKRKKGAAESSAGRLHETAGMFGPEGPAATFSVFEGKSTFEFLSPVTLEPSTTDEEGLYFGNANKDRPGTIIGYVRITMDKSRLKAEMQSTLLRNTLIAALFMLFGSILAYVAIRRVTRPLAALTESVRLLGMGEMDVKVPVESSDEIGKLAKAFNAMSDNLLRRDEEKRYLAEQLRLAQKMEAVGTLARGIAHDFNNILATVQGSLFLLEKKLRGDDQLILYVSQIHSSLRKVRDLIERLLAFSRIRKINSRQVDVNTIISNLQPMLVDIAGEGIAVETRLSEEPLTILADTVQIDQVIVNLFMNARDAMPAGGLFIIETELVVFDDDMPEELKEGPLGYVLISVRDTGTGMTEETKERVFEPFFTTKEVGKGTGLGLSIVYGIVQENKGHIVIHSQKGEGTQFKIYFPLVEKNDADQENKDVRIQGRSG